MTASTERTRALRALAARMTAATVERRIAALETLAARAFADAEDAWRRWPHLRRVAADEERRTDVNLPEDDGSAAWGHLIVFFEISEVVSRGSEPELVREAAARYLDEQFNICANVQASGAPSGVVSQATADERIDSSVAWLAALELVDGL